jgi:hypothetical protein
VDALARCQVFDVENVRSRWKLPGDVVEVALDVERLDVHGTLLPSLLLEGEADAIGLGHERNLVGVGSIEDPSPLQDAEHDDHQENHEQQMDQVPAEGSNECSQQPEKEYDYDDRFESIA